MSTQGINDTFCFSISGSKSIIVGIVYVQFGAISKHQDRKYNLHCLIRINFQPSNYYTQSFLINPKGDIQQKGIFTYQSVSATNPNCARHECD
jgi:hypothetical protein